MKLEQEISGGNVKVMANEMMSVIEKFVKISEYALEISADDGYKKVTLAEFYDGEPMSAEAHSRDKFKSAMTKWCEEAADHLFLISKDDFVSFRLVITDFEGTPNFRVAALTDDNRMDVAIYAK